MPQYDQAGLSQIILPKVLMIVIQFRSIGQGPNRVLEDCLKNRDSKTVQTQPHEQRNYLKVHETRLTFLGITGKT